MKGRKHKYGFNNNKHEKTEKKRVVDDETGDKHELYELKQLHKELGSSHSHKKHKRHTTENDNDSGKVVGNSVESVDINKELSLGHVKFDQFKRQQSDSGNADGENFS
ncbi:hypothetical protein JHK82_018874 [Glycine max]|nr:hypothetical protein JHK82_018874 [Glycine max]